MDWATFWAIFSQIHLVTLACTYIPSSGFWKISTIAFFVLGHSRICGKIACQESILLTHSFAQKISDVFLSHKESWTNFSLKMKTK
jgi:hypothetical protein